jgi:hypothetical protein
VLADIYIILMLQILFMAVIKFKYLSRIYCLSKDNENMFFEFSHIFLNVINYGTLYDLSPLK